MTAQTVSPIDDQPEELGWVGHLGAAAIDLLIGGRELYSVFVRTLYYTARGRREKGAVVAQMYEIGNKSLFFLSITMGFIGMILAYQAGLQAKRVVPDFTMLGATYLELLVRDLAASLGALMLATRVGAGIAAEIGSMVVTEQIDALRMCAADPIDFLIKPRFIASIVMTIVLIVWSGAVAFVSGAITAYLAFDVPLQTFFNASLVDVGDMSVGVAKCFAYGAAIPVVSGYCGLSTFGGSEGVGWATTRAVVNTSLAIIILNFFISGAGFLIFPG
ncbi:ABC-type transport system involved in resistance to organic solvent, permease component [Labilithrix luteola]|uniref:ABC-type transport system involved in resistance to organic solvent, permease component n=1 Tax=Labilithrix luteola TaxID=1391654 RepID=A0A0K1Q824_9BACT|nr:ABC transporter permease [Labilithrix luteola]AKV01802.1 ABC-type transport system involved in resistance to organic solvent, permease component [Labilithrix luteola]